MTIKVRVQLPENTFESGEPRRQTIATPNRYVASAIFQGWGPKL